MSPNLAVGPADKYRTSSRGPSSGRRLLKADINEGRFWSYVDRSGECWNWTGSLDRIGYGNFAVLGRRSAAHRASYALAHGEAPAGMVICHGCDNRKCVRPEHLFSGSQSDNVRDAMQKGRHPGTGLGPQQLPRALREKPPRRCTNGHLVTDANSYVSKAGLHRCRLCTRARNARYLERKKTFNAD